MSELNKAKKSLKAIFLSAVYTSICVIFTFIMNGDVSRGMSLGVAVLTFAYWLFAYNPNLDPSIKLENTYSRKLRRERKVFRRSKITYLYLIFSFVFIYVLATGMYQHFQWLVLLCLWSIVLLIVNIFTPINIIYIDEE